MAYEELGDLEVARAAYETALALDTQLLMGRYRLAELLLDAGQVEEGFRIIDAGVRIVQQGQIDLGDEDRARVAFSLFTTRGRAYLLRAGWLDALPRGAQNEAQNVALYVEHVAHVELGK